MSNAELHSTCERIARLEQQRKEIAAEISTIKKDAKDKGFDAALITKTVRVMLMGPKKRRETLEQHELFDTYLAAAGLLPSFQANVDEREKVKATATLYRMEDTARQSQELADAGLISQDAAEETRRIAEAINRKWGDGQPVVTTAAEPKLWAAPDVAAGIPAHDAETGEIIGDGGTVMETEPLDCPPGPEQAAAELPNVPPTPAAAAVFSYPDPDITLPDFLDRRNRQAVLAQRVLDAAQ